MVGLDVNCNGQKELDDTEADWSGSGLEHSNRLASRISIKETNQIYLQYKLSSVRNIRV